MTRAMALATRSCWRSCSVEEATSSVFLRGRTGSVSVWLSAGHGSGRRTLCEDGFSDPEGEPRRASSVKTHRSEKRQMRGKRRGRVGMRGRGSARSHHVLGVAVVLVEAGADGERRIQPAERAPHHAHVAHRRLELLVVRQLRGTRGISGQPADGQRRAAGQAARTSFSRVAALTWRLPRFGLPRARRCSSCFLR